MSAQPEDVAGHVEILNMLAAAFDRFGWDDTALGAYLAVLHDLDEQLLRRAALDLMAEPRAKMPTPGEVRGRALGLLVGEPPGEDAAYAEVQAAFGTVGRHGTPSWSSPVITAAVEGCGGWSRLCGYDESRSSYAFRGAYRVELGRAQRTALMSPGLRDVAQLVANNARLPGLHALPPSDNPQETSP